MEEFPPSALATTGHQRMKAISKQKSRFYFFDCHQLSVCTDYRDAFLNAFLFLVFDCSS